MAQLPQIYRKSTEIQFNVDFVDSLAGVAYKKFYMATVATGDNTFDEILTFDNTMHGDEASANFKVTTNSDLDFDMNVEKPFTLAAKEAFIYYVQDRGSDSIGVVWTIEHIDSGGNKTTLGTVTGDTTGANTSIEAKTVVVTLTRKVFNKGDKLRINANITTGSSSHIFFDPTGSVTGDSINGITLNKTAWASLPIEIPL